MALTRGIVMSGPKVEPKKTPQKEGLGVLCPEAQADGVPCFELGRECETCDKAVPADGTEPEADGTE